MSRYLHEGDVLQTSHLPGAPRLVVLSDKRIEGCVKVFDSASRSEKYLSAEEIDQNLSTRAWTVARPNAPTVSLLGQQSAALAHGLQQAGEILRQVLDTAKQCGVSFNRAYELACSRSASNGAALPSKATLYRHFAAKRQDLPLLRGDKNKGRRTPRYKPEVDELIVELGTNHFLRPHSKWRMGPITEQLNVMARERGYLTEGHKVSSRYVTRVIRTRLGPDSEARRMDPKEVAAARSIGAQRQLVRTPWERVELDAVHLPYVIQTQHGISTDVWLIIAIDCASSMVVGWHLVVGRPTEDDCLQCIHTLINSKAKHFKRLGLAAEWDIHGTPGLLVMDNGPENKGDRIQKLAFLDIEVQYCKSRHPHQKPYVERLNRSLKVSLETLPGCTRKDGVDGTRNPIALGEKIMTLQELEVWIVRWFYESWAHQPLERLAQTICSAYDIQGKTPATRWQHFTSENGYASTLPVPEDAWRQAMFIRNTRTISRKTGITYEGLNYKGPELTWLVAHLGECEVTVLVDPCDYRFLYVDVGTDRPLVVLTEQWVNHDSPAYTFGEYKRLNAETQRLDPMHLDAQKFRRDLLERSAQAEAPKNRRRSAERNHVTAHKSRQHAAMQRAVERPLPTVPFLDTLEHKEGFSFDALSSLEVLDRKSGGKR